MYILRALLDHDYRGHCPTGRCIVLGVADVHFAIAVDNLAPTKTIHESIVTNPTYSSIKQKHSYISCVTEEGVIVLNGHTLLNNTSLIIGHNDG